MATQSKTITATQPELAQRNGNILDKVINQTAYSLASARETQLAKTAIRELVEHAVRLGHSEQFDELDDLVSDAIGELEHRLNDQLNAIVHAPKYQELYATWNGIEYLFKQASGETFELRVLNVSKEEIRRDLRRCKGDHRRSEMFRRLAAEEYMTDGGKPYSFVVLDSPVSHEQGDVELLNFLGKIGQDAHFIVIGAASPKFFGGQGFADLPYDPQNLTDLFTASAYIKWREFRETDQAKHVGLVLPRMLMRPAYDRNDNPAEGLEFFYERINSHDDLAWGSPAYAFAARMGASLRDHGFPTAITGARGGGKVDGLPVVSFPTDHGQETKPPIEIELNQLLEWRLSSELGFIPLTPTRDTAHAIFYGAPSTQIPPKRLDLKTKADAGLRAQIPHLAACNRIAHHVKHMLRQMVGQSLAPAEVEEELNRWLKTLCLANPDTATPEQKAKHPLRAARVKVSAIDGETGFYEVDLELEPHQKLIAVKVTLRLQSEIEGRDRT